MRTIHVRVDAETEEALKRIERTLGVGVGVGRRSGKTSIAVRQALLNEAARLDEKGGKP
jgi:hypothetical protein